MDIGFGGKECGLESGREFHHLERLLWRRKRDFEFLRVGRVLELALVSLFFLSRRNVRERENE